MMNQKSKLRVLIALAIVSALAGLGACSEATPKLVIPDRTPPAEDPGVATANGTLQGGSEVDILFIVDDSGSMGTHQYNLSQNISRFLGTFFGGTAADFHIGVLKTSGAGELIGYPKYIGPTTPNGLNLLSQTLRVGTWGRGPERIFAPVRGALSEPYLSGSNSGFLRKDAHLAVVIITDAEDQSAETAQMFHDFLLSVKPGQPEKILVYAVYIPVNAPYGCTRDDSGAPKKIDEFMRLSGGQSFGLCDPDYGDKLAAMGAHLAGKVLKSIYLKRKPVESTIRVRYGAQVVPRDLDFGWSYDPDRVALRFGPKLVWSKQKMGTKVEVDYVPADEPKK